MSSLLLLVGLVTAAFTVSALLGRRGHYGFLGGSEYLFIGALLGPVLGIVDAESASVVRPLVLLCSCFMGLSLGLRLPAPLRRLRLTEFGALLAELVLVVGIADVGLGLLPANTRLGFAGPMPHALRIGLGLIAAPTTKATWAWARRQLGATGETADFLERIAATDDLFPVLGLLALIAWSAASIPAALLGGATPSILPPAVLVGSTVGLALVGALSFTALAGRRPHAQHAWVALIGVLLLSTGVSSRLGLPVLTGSALCGALMTLLSEQPETLQEEMMQPTERPVVLVLLIVIGTQLELSLSLVLPLCAAVLLRVIGKLTAGAVMAPLGSRSFGSGLGLLGFGGVPAALAAQLALSWPGVAKLIFAVAASFALVGDITAPLGLRWLIGRRTEPAPIAAGPTSTEPTEPTQSAA